MYKNQRNGGSRQTTQSRRNYFSRNRSRGGGPRESKLSPHLFIKKASFEEVDEVKYSPKNKFNDFNILDSLKRNISKKGYIDPTPIQDQTIPEILNGRDVVGIANTGTGKTAAFLIPLINKVLKDRNQKTIIIVPTRELAVQINDEFRGFTPGMQVFSTICIGGSSMERQISNLRRRPQFIIGTPGRLVDLIKRRSLNLSDFGNFVLDEVDRMLDMGFIEDIKYLISHLPKERQSLFFSATMTKGAEGLVKSFLTDPISVSVKTRETSANVDQDIVKFRNSNDKIEVLSDLLSKEDFKKVIIFGKTKFGVEKLSISLNKRGFKSDSIHGDKSQNKRQRALDQFKRNFVNILVATDVAARGLDITDITHVINYDPPMTYDDYVHRIGRTGRANKKGYAITFVQ